VYAKAFRGRDLDVSCLIENLVQCSNTLNPILLSKRHGTVNFYVVFGAPNGAQRAADQAEGGTLRYLSLHSHSLRKVQGCRAHPARIFVICSLSSRANFL